MEAVIISGGKQYRVREGEVVRLERLPAEQGATVEFREVAYLKADGDPIVTRRLSGRRACSARSCGRAARGRSSW